MTLPDSNALQRLLDRDENQETTSRVARGVDRGNEDLIRSAYRTDACDDHVDDNGDIDRSIAWPHSRFSPVALGCARSGEVSRGSRSLDDPLFACRKDISGDVA